MFEILTLWITNYVFIYPIAMSIIWVIGSLYFWFQYENKDKDSIKRLKIHPNITILVPCHNEANSIAMTCKNLSSLDYPNYQVIFIDDESKDNTAEVLRTYVDKYPHFHLLRLKENQGKAGALNIGLKYVTTAYVLVLDADTIISGDTIKWLVLPFTRRENLGAVTANPIPHNKETFLSKLQTAEFMSIIGLTKRTQGILGHFFTISGCATLYRIDVLRKIGGFSHVTATEDIDVSWRIQRASYKIWFQPQALAFIQVPISLKEYWKQRKRWAMGGWHLLRTHKDIFCRWHLRNLWLLFFDFILAYCWAFCFVLVTLHSLIRLPDTLASASNLTLSYCTVAIFVYMIQSVCAIGINSVYDKTIRSSFLYIPWYPFFFFMIGAVLVVWTSPKSLFGSLENCGKWSSPKRIIQS